MEWSGAKNHKSDYKQSPQTKELPDKGLWRVIRERQMSFICNLIRQDESERQVKVLRKCFAISMKTCVLPCFLMLWINQFTTFSLFLCLLVSFSQSLSLFENMHMRACVCLFVESLYALWATAHMWRADDKLSACPHLHLVWEGLLHVLR